jgi:uncharacterized membrane protein YcaP (DUF421 family)
MTIVLIRSLILYFVAIFSVRLMGKRQIGELQPAELVVTILVSNIATLSLENIEIPLLHGILAILALVCYEVLVSWGSLKSVRLRRWISGSPKIIIREGRIDQEMLHALRFSVDDLMTSLRMGGVFFLRDVQFAIVETNGSVSVYQKSAAQPATRQDVNSVQPAIDPPQVIVADGQLREKALHAIGQYRKWVEAVLRASDMTMPEVFLLTADSACHYDIVRLEKKGTKAA